MMQLRIEVFNLFNEAHLFVPLTIATNSATFGRVTQLRPQTQPRVIQLGAKFLF